MTGNGGEPVAQHTPSDDGGCGFFETTRASETELLRRMQRSEEIRSWNTPVTKGRDTLRLATINAANNMPGTTDWLLLKAAMAL